jgi:SNF2 family DNA or RNA helicase
MLDLIQQALSTYSFNICRIDGSTGLEGRTMALKRFNEDPDCSVMLATIGSAGEGLDLTVANNVHLIEPHWNPMAEAQAVDRVYRIGQQREVIVTRYIVPNSIETYIQWVQQQKLKLVSKIVDTEGATQAEIDMERYKQLRENLGCEA